MKICETSGFIVLHKCVYFSAIHVFRVVSERNLFCVRWQSLSDLRTPVSYRKEQSNLDQELQNLKAPARKEMKDAADFDWNKQWLYEILIRATFGISYSWYATLYFN